MGGGHRGGMHLIVVGGVTALLVGFTLLSDGFAAFRSEPRPHTLLGPAAKLHAHHNPWEERAWPDALDADGRWRGSADRAHHVAVISRSSSAAT